MTPEELEFLMSLGDVNNQLQNAPRRRAQLANTTAPVQTGPGWAGFGANIGNLFRAVGEAAGTGLLMKQENDLAQRQAQGRRIGQRLDSNAPSLTAEGTAETDKSDAAKIAEFAQKAQLLIQSGDPRYMATGKQMEAQASDLQKSLLEAPERRIGVGLKKAQTDKTLADTAILSEPASDENRVFLRKLGGNPEGMNRRQISDAIDARLKAYGIEQTGVRTDRRNERGHAIDEQRFGKDMEQLPRVKTLLGTLSAAASAPPGADIPGVGVLDTRRPDWANTPAGIAIRQAAMDLAAVIVKEDSGAQATDQEWARKMQAAGFSTWNSESGFKNGVARMKKIMADAYRLKRAKYSEDIVKNVESRYGAKLELNFDAQPSADTGKVKYRETATGRLLQGKPGQKIPGWEEVK